MTDEQEQAVATLNKFSDMVRAIAYWIRDGNKIAPPSPIPPAMQVLIRQIGALATLSEQRIADLYVELDYPYGIGYAGIWQFMQNIGMTPEQIATIHKESTDANE